MSARTASPRVSAATGCGCGYELEPSSNGLTGQVTSSTRYEAPPTARRGPTPARSANATATISAAPRGRVESGPVSDHFRSALRASLSSIQVASPIGLLHGAGAPGGIRTPDP